MTSNPKTQTSHSQAPRLSLIVAKSLNGVIGVDGKLPWRLSSDLKFFKATTMGKPVLMGRKTWESLPFPLPGRPNLVLTRDKGYSAPKAEVFNNVYDMIGRGYELAGLSGQSEVMLIGGAQLYASLLRFVDRMYISEVQTIIDGDAHFPAVQSSDWSLTEERAMPKGKGDDYAFDIKIFDRRRANITQ